MTTLHDRHPVVMTALGASSIRCFLYYAPLPKRPITVTSDGARGRGDNGFPSDVCGDLSFATVKRRGRQNQPKIRCGNEIPRNVTAGTTTMLPVRIPVAERS